MAILKISKLNWKDRQIAAINRLSKRKRWPAGPDNPYFDRIYECLYKDEIKTKAQMKQELKKHGYK